MLADARDTRTERVALLIRLLKAETALKRAAAALALPWYFDTQALEPLLRQLSDIHTRLEQRIGSLQLQRSGRQSLRDRIMDLSGQAVALICGSKLNALGEQPCPFNRNPEHISNRV